MARVDFDVEFFYGRNEELLYQTTLNDIQIDELPKLVRALQGYLEADASTVVIKSISIDGCDDATIHLEGHDPIEICSETTFDEMLLLMPHRW